MNSGALSRSQTEDRYTRVLKTSRLAIFLSSRLSQWLSFYHCPGGSGPLSFWYQNVNPWSYQKSSGRPLETSSMMGKICRVELTDISRLAFGLAGLTIICFLHLGRGISVPSVSSQGHERP